MKQLFTALTPKNLGLRAKNSLILSGASFARNLLGLLNIILIARYLEPDEFGRLMFVFAVAGVLSPLAAFGIERLAVRQMVAEPERVDRIAATALLLRFTGACFGVIVAISIASSGLLNVNASPLLTALACGALFLAAIDGLTGTLIARENFVPVAVTGIVASLANFAFILALTSGPNRALEAFAASRVVEAVIFITGIILAVRMARIPLAHFAPDRDILIGFLKQGLPIFLSAIAYTVFLRMDQLMLAALSTETEIGIYSLSLRFAEALNFIPTMIALAFYPHLTRLYQETRAAYEAELHFLFDTMAVVSAGVIVIVWIAASVVLTPLFGEAYSRSTGVAALLALAIPFVAMGIARSSVFTITGQTWLPLAVWSGPVVVNFFGNLLLIPRFDAYGAAISTVLSLLFAHIGTSFLFPSLRHHGKAMAQSLNLARSAPRVIRRLRGA